MIKTNDNEVRFGGTLGKDLELKGGNNGQNSFGVVSVAQTTYWPKQGEQGFNERTTWMNLKLNGPSLQKAQRLGGLYKGDEIAVKGYLVQRKVGQEGHMITEIQVESIVSHMSKALKDLAKQAGLNKPSQPQQPNQHANTNQQHAPQHAPRQAPQPQYAPQRQHLSSQPQVPADQQQPQQQGQDNEWGNEFYGSRNQ